MDVRRRRRETGAARSLACRRRGLLEDDGRDDTDSKRDGRTRRPRQFGSALDVVSGRTQTYNPPVVGSCVTCQPTMACIGRTPAHHEQLQTQCPRCLRHPKLSLDYFCQLSSKVYVGGPPVLTTLRKRLPSAETSHDQTFGDPRSWGGPARNAGVVAMSTAISSSVRER